MKFRDQIDQPHLDKLIQTWGMDKLELVTGYGRSAIYQWKPSRVPVPAEAALRINEFAQSIAGFDVETMRPDLPWHLVYGGRDRRRGIDGHAVAPHDLDNLVRSVGVTDLSRATGKSRQCIYNAAKSERCPVWLALGIEQVTDHRFLVEDIRPELPWWPLYARRERAYPLLTRKVVA